jgi:hypothetical protein
MISLLLLSSIGFADSTVTERFVEPVAISSVSITDTPTYFFKPSPDGRYFGYTTWKPVDGHDANKNILLDSQSGTFLQMPGAYDPMFMLNSRNLVVPGIQGLRFFNLDDIINQQTNAQPIFTDAEFKGVYESVGVLSRVDNQIKYRVIIENGKRFYRDYTETLDATGKTIKFETASPVNPLCTNHNFALPMVSKDGLEASGLDHSTGKSRVYKINADNTCDVVEELGYLAGKISFAYNQRYISFHVFHRADTLGQFAFGHIAFPGSNTTANIYIKDREKNITYKLTNFVDGNAMYPEFLSNGDIVYVLYPHDRTKHKPRFIRVKPTIY